MKCPFCGASDTQVIETRTSEDGDTNRRRRRCASCDKRFTTYERVELQLPQIVKKDGSRHDFDRNKVLASMALALRKRNVDAEARDAAVSRVAEALAQSGEREVPSQRVGELVMHELKKLDHVAYIRFASVYRNFADIDEFSLAVRELS